MEVAQPREVFVNTGAGLQSIWLNGRRIFTPDRGVWTGWHAGRERIPVTLQKGPNTLIIETGKEFFLSITDTDRW